MSEIEIEILRRTVADLTQRVQTLEMALNPGVASCCDVTGEPCACGERRCDPAPVPSCGVAQPGDVGGWYDCDLPQGHEGPHECDGSEWSDPAPPPEWRRLVDEGETAIWADCGPEIGLSRVLQDLARLTADAAEIVRIYALARIVAVCEAQVGDGWQADPCRVCPTVWTIGWLMLPLSSNQWDLVGNRAAAWLKALTEEQS